MYQKRMLPYIIIPYLLTPSFFLFKPSQTDGQISTPPVTKFFLWLAELWGGWPIELGRY
jgi:hypothetical protein